MARLASQARTIAIASGNSFTAVPPRGDHHCQVVSDITTRLVTTGQLLIRSAMEIDLILTSMVEDHAAVTADLKEQLIFLSKLVSIDSIKRRVLLAYSDYKAANNALLKSVSATLRCNHRGAQFGFTAAKPRLASFGSRPAIEIDWPDMVLALQGNKKPVRTPIPKQPPDLRCRLPMGALWLEARLVDMSLDGRAFLLGEAAIPVCAGTWLCGARITPMGGEPIVVAIEVKQVIPTVLPDGERATRIACRIVAPSERIEQLTRTFIIDFAM